MNSDTSISATSPAGAAGTVDVTVTTDGGASPTGTADGYTYVAAPTVSSVSPNSGPIAGGTSVTITGTGYFGGTGASNVIAVKFGSVAASAYTVASDTSITATSPAGAAGFVDVTVSTDGGTSAFGVTDRYRYVPPPTVTALSLSRGPSAGGTTVTITGSGYFGGSAAGNVSAVRFGAAAATGVTVISDAQVTALSPAGVAGSVDVTVSTDGGVSATGSGDLFTYVTAPTVTAVSPIRGQTAGGTSVTITGTGFFGGTGAANVSAVKFGSVAASSYAVSSDTGITATSPAGAAGTVDVTVTTDGGASPTGTADGYTYVAAPTVSSVSPGSGPITGGTSVTIAGTGYFGGTGASNVSAVRFGSVAAGGYTVASDSSITATSPAGAAGIVDVTVSTDGGASASGTADRYRYIPPPTVTALSLTRGPSAGGTTVTITGSGYFGGSAAGNVSAVRFGSVAATGVTVISDAQVTAVSPAGAAGTVDVTVSTDGGASATGSGDRYTYVTAPTVTAVSPIRGQTAGGTGVTITGTGFFGGTGAGNVGVVKFGTVAASAYTVSSDTGITATSPAESAGTVDVTITTDGGTSATGAADQFTFAVVDHIVLSPGSASIVAGGSQSYTVQAYDSANNSLGDVTSASSYGISPDGSCTGASCTATVSGAHTVTATYSSKTASSSLSVSAGPAVRLTVTGLNDIQPGLTQNASVTAYDSYSNVASGYGGTVHLTSTDPEAVLGADAQLSAGQRAFSVQLWTTRAQTVTATDTVNSSLTASQTVTIRAYGGYVLDGFGGVHGYSLAPLISDSTHAYWSGNDIARGLVVRPDGTSGYTLDGYGGVHNFVAPGHPALADPSTTVYWNNWDIGRSLALNPADPSGHSGWVLDGWGGIHAFGGAANVPQSNSAYWSGWDIARGIVVRPDGLGGYVVDGYGGVHGWWVQGAAAVSNPSTTWYQTTSDLARGIALNQNDSSGGSGYVLDGYGGIHPFGGAPAISGAPTFGTDLARGIVMNQPGSQRNQSGAYAAYVNGYVVDGWGGLHAFWRTGQTPIADGTTSAYWNNWDIVRGIGATGTGGGAEHH